MGKLLPMAAILAIMCLAGLASAEGYCGDDTCGSGESCSTCKWDCGVCANESEGVQGVITKPTARTVSVPATDSGYISCPVTYLSHTISGGYNTSVRMKIANPSGSPTGAFRLKISSGPGWFVPKNMTYALPPDGYDAGGWPYWDMPPMGRNGSAEIAFTAKGSVGLVYMLVPEAEPLGRWGASCTYLVPVSGSGLNQNVSRYLDSLNWSQNATVYYTDGYLALAYLGKNGSFAVFSTGGANITVVSDYAEISGLVSKYAIAATPLFYGDTSKPHRALNYSKLHKAKAENECMAITGMQKHQCVDRPTCSYACASVPVCQYMAQAGWPFIDSMLAYRLAVDGANAALERAIASSHAFGQSPSKGTAETALSDMESLNRYETAVASQNVFSKYNFCPPPDYAMPQVTDGQRQLMDYLANNCVEGQKGRITSQSFTIAPALVRAEEEAAAMRAAEVAAAIRAAAEAAAIEAAHNASIAANASMNASANATAGMNGTIATNATANLTANVTANLTANINATANATANGTAAAANATSGNGGVVPENITIAVPPGLRDAGNAYCHLPMMLLTALLALSMYACATRKAEPAAVSPCPRRHRRTAGT